MSRKQVKSGVTGVYMKRSLIGLQDVNKHRRLYNYIGQYYRRNKSPLNFAPSILAILDVLPQLAFTPCFFLSYTLARINELEQIKISDIIQRKPLLIKSSKSKHIRSIAPLNAFKIKVLQGVSPDTDLMVVSYDSLVNSINSAKARCNIPNHKTRLDATHIFRHLQATYLFNSGVPISDISEKLGHTNNKTTLQYIHEKE